MQVTHTHTEHRHRKWEGNKKKIENKITLHRTTHEKYRKELAIHFEWQKNVRNSEKERKNKTNDYNIIKSVFPVPSSLSLSCSRALESINIQTCVFSNDTHTLRLS